MGGHFFALSGGNITDGVLVKCDLPVGGSLCLKAYIAEVDIARILYGKNHILRLTRIGTGGKIAIGRSRRKAVGTGDLNGNRELECLSCTVHHERERILTCHYILRGCDCHSDRRSCAGFYRN